MPSDDEDREIARFLPQRYSSDVTAYDDFMDILRDAGWRFIDIIFEGDDIGYE